MHLALKEHRWIINFLGCKMLISIFLERNSLSKILHQDMKEWFSWIACNELLHYLQCFTRCGRKLWNLGKTSTSALFCQKPVEKCYCGKSQFFEVPIIQMVSQALKSCACARERCFCSLGKKNREREAIHERILDIVSDLLLLNIKTPLEESCWRQTLRNCRATLRGLPGMTVSCPSDSQL